MKLRLQAKCTNINVGPGSVTRKLSPSRETAQLDSTRPLETSRAEGRRGGAPADESVPSGHRDRPGIRSSLRKQVCSSARPERPEPLPSSAEAHTQLHGADIDCRCAGDVKVYGGCLPKYTGAAMGLGRCADSLGAAGWPQRWCLLRAPLQLLKPTRCARPNVLLQVCKGPCA